MGYEDKSNHELIQIIHELNVTKKTNEEEIRQLERDLVKLNKKLQESEALKSHFVSNICNEIINPFTSVIALANNVLKVDKENWKSVISMVALIHKEVSNLDFQLKNIFAAAKLEAGEFVPEVSSVDIDSLFTSLIEQFKYTAKHKGLEIFYESNTDITKNGKYFNTDSEKLNLIISNLLSNAIKFSFEKGKINIKVLRVHDRLIVEVQDFGYGISKENENIIFDRFKRIDSGINSINRGHGLGLSVNKAMLDILEGTISFTSKINEGAKFIVHIPESKEKSTGISFDNGGIIFKEEKF
jgi:signal transduction histidine kinase